MWGRYCGYGGLMNTVGIIQVGTRIVKYDDFITAYIERLQDGEGQQCVVIIECTLKKYPVYKGTIDECMEVLKDYGIAHSELDGKHIINSEDEDED